MGKKEAAEHRKVEISVDRDTMFSAFISFGELGSFIWNCKYMEKYLELMSYGGEKYYDRKFIVHWGMPTIRRSVNRVQLLYY